MNPDAIALFRELADRSDAEREEYYARHHVAAAVRAEVESLLGFDRQTGDSLHDQIAAAAESVLGAGVGSLKLTAVAAEAAARARAKTMLPLSGVRPIPAPPRLVEEPGVWLGAYRLRELLGEGGMGSVWLADQDRPIHRAVAVKIVKPGADLTHVLSRFESERQALAILNHPHIAKVFDAGTRPDGRPYFVMEFVDGQPLTTFADRRRLTITERLELFLQVCDAVQHAHQKGLLHRDLKPANILVADLDGRAVAKVIDFGIAKAVGQRLTPHTIATEVGAFVGTPEYMSPEQAGLVDADVDTRTDIFSLGVVLYELLVGVTPFEALKHHPSAVLEMLRVVREEEPPRLTRRLTSQGATATQEIAHRRQTDPRALRGLLRGDLEWITGKAIEKEPGRRYASASELAADVRRYLDSEPVAAGPPDLIYRLRKLTRKHRGSAIVAAVATGIVIAASLVSTFFWIRSEQARRETRRQLVSLHVAEGMRLVDENDHLRALPWLAEALRVEPDTAAQEAHRRRLGMVLDRTPTLAKVWTFEPAAPHWEIAPERTWLAQGSVDGTLRIVDIEEGSMSTSRERHPGGITAVAISRDGLRLATAGHDGSARLWGRTLEAAGPPLHHGDEVLSLAISPDGNRIATVSHDRVARVWDGRSGALQFDLRHDSRVSAVGFSPDGGLIATGSGSALKLWNARTGHPEAELQHPRQIDHFRFSDDGTRLAVAANNTLRVWDLTNRQPLGQEIQQTNPIYQVTFSPDSRWVALGSAGNILGIVNARTGALATPMIRRRDQVLDVAFSPDGQFLASLELGGHIQVWRTGSWQPQPLVVRGSANARSVFFDRSSRRLVSSAEDVVVVWDLAAASPSHPVMAHGGAVRDLSVAPDGQTFITTTGVLGSRDNFVRVWASGSSEPVTPPLREGGFIKAAADGLGLRIATGGEDGRARIWDAKSGEPLGPPLLHGRFIVSLAFSADGRYLATAGGDGERNQRLSRAGDVRVWDAGSGTLLWSRPFTAGITALALTPDGTRLAVGTNDGKVTFWAAGSGERLPGELHHGSTLYTIAISADGRWSASLSDRGTHVWDHLRAEGKQLETKAGVSISFDSENTRAAIGTFDGTVSIWNLLTGQPLGPGMKPGGMIYSARFDGSDRYVVTASMDGSTRVWDLTGRALSPRLPHDGPVWSARFLPQDQQILSGGGGSARAWNFPMAEGTAEDLTRLSEVLGGYRLSESMAPLPLTARELQQRFDELAMRRPAWFSVTPQKEAQWRRSAADWARRTGRVHDALRHFDRLVELEPARAMTWAERGGIRAELGHWSEAIRDFEKAFELRPDAAEHVRDLALARLGGGDEMSFRRACKALIDRFGTTDNPDRAQWVARTCVLALPAAGEEVSSLVRTAERWRDVEPGGVHQLGTLGAALLRAGRDDAADTLREALRAAGARGDRWASLFLQIADSKHRRRTTACQPAATAPDAMDSQQSRASDTNVSWRQRVELDTLTRELCR